MLIYNFNYYYNYYVGEVIVCLSKNFFFANSREEWVRFIMSIRTPRLVWRSVEILNQSNTWFIPLNLLKNGVGPVDQNKIKTHFGTSLIYKPTHFIFFFML